MDKKRVTALIIAIASIALIAVCAIGLIGGMGESSSLLQTTQSAMQETKASETGTAAKADPSLPEATQSADASGEEQSSPSSGNMYQGAAQEAVSQVDSSSSTRTQDSTITVSVTVDATAVDAGSQAATVTLDEGASVYDALAASGFSYNSSTAQFGAYISAIGGLAEKQHGATSGWTYSVDGSYPSASCSNYVLANGDAIVWIYKLEA